MKAAVFFLKCLTLILMLLVSIRNVSAETPVKQSIINQLIKDIHFNDFQGKSILPIWQKKRFSIAFVRLAKMLGV